MGTLHLSVQNARIEQDTTRLSDIHCITSQDTVQIIGYNERSAQPQKIRLQPNHITLYGYNKDYYTDLTTCCHLESSILNGLQAVY